jgi:hypothetical protein
VSYAATYGNHDQASSEQLLRRDHPLRLRKTYEEPADLDERPSVRRWSLGIATGALLVAGTFAAGVLGLNGAAQQPARPPRTGRPGTERTRRSRGRRTGPGRESEPAVPVGGLDHQLRRFRQQRQWQQHRQQQ